LPLPVAATRIAARHSDKPVAVEVVRWRQAPAATTETAAPTEAEAEHDDAGAATVTPITPPLAGSGLPHAGAAAVTPPRPRLLAVLSFPDTDEVEVHLVLHSRRTIGRAVASRGLVAVVDATLEALRGFSVDLPVQPKWAREVEEGTGDRRLVAIAVEEPESGRQLFGLANGSSAIDAGARATLDALNRQITRALDH
jgi:hypothetical protein